MNKQLPSDRNYEECRGHEGHEVRLVRNESDIQLLFGKMDTALDLLHKIDKVTSMMWAKAAGLAVGAGFVIGVVWRLLDKVSFSSILR